MRPIDPQLAARLDQAIAQLERAAELQKQLGELTAEGAAAEGLIRVEVGPSGHPTSLTIDPRAMRMDSTSLSEAVLAAIGSARDQLYQRLGGLTGSAPRGLDVPSLLSGRTSPALGSGEAGDPGAAIRQAIEKLRKMRG